MIKDREGLVKLIITEQHGIKYPQPGELADALIRECPGIFLDPPGRVWQKCPKCDGQGIVSKPPYIAGDQNQWSSTPTSFICDVCQGAKIIPTPDRSKFVEREKVLEWIENNETNHYEILNANALKAFIREEGKK